MHIKLDGWSRDDILMVITRAYGRVQFDFGSLMGSLSEEREKQLLLDLRIAVEAADEEETEERVSVATPQTTVLEDDEPPYIDLELDDE